MRFADFWARRRALAADWLPFAILLAMALAWLAMGLDRDYFYRPRAHSSQSAETLAMADNLSPSRAFLVYRRAYLRADGETGYEVYNRFPLGGYALVKLAMLPFENDLAAKILAARTLTLAMFGGAAALFYLALARLLANRWAALGAVALAFSGHHLLYYSDMIDTERTMGVFGIALTFHGMAVFVREGRVRQLALKSGAAMLLDWQALALLLPFAVFGAARAAIRAARAGDGASKARIAFVPAIFGAARSPHAAAAAVALTVAAAMMGFSLINEYAALGGETPISEMPTVQSAAVRLSGESGGEFSWARFLRTELHRAGAAHLSLALPGYGDGLVRMGQRWDGWIMSAGAAALVACAAAVFWARKRAPLLVPLALSVFIWDLAIRQYVVEHLFQSPFHFAPALALFSVAALYAGERFGARASAAIALAAAAVFMLCAFQMNALTHGEDDTEKALVSDFEAMRETARGKTIYFDPSIRANMSAGFPHDADFFLSGATVLSFNSEYLIQPDAMQPVIEAADLVLSRERFEGVESLTPNNREAFLYDSRDIAAMRLAEYRAVVSSGEPLARGEFDVYADGGALVYAKSPCAAADTRTRFFLHVYAADFSDLPRNRRLQGFEGLDFRFGRYGAIFGGKCMARVGIPQYAVSKIDTGQFTSGGGRTWSAEARFEVDMDGYFRKAYESAALIEPAARSDFDVYLTDGALIYVKESRPEDCARGRFLLSAFPSNDGDLEEGREKSGHNSLNFSFDEYGGAVDGRCVIRRPLPDYPLERLEIGQWIPGGDTLWRMEISIRD